MLVSGERTLLAGLESIGIKDDPNAPPTQTESIFIALDRSSTSVPVTRKGRGGALTSLGRDLIVMTHEGGFFDVTGDTAVALTIMPPANGWDDMLAFEAANPSYNFAHYYFRYNDLNVFEDKLLVSYTEWVAANSCYRTSLAVAPLSGARASADVKIAPDDWSILYSTDPCLPPKTVGRAIDGHMAGGRFHIGQDRTIYLASGDDAVDGTYAPVALSQDPSQDYGKVLAIDLDTGAAEKISQGHSNMQGIVVDATGVVYAVEHGRRGGDELNRILPGRDYGWPKVSLGTRYNRLPLQSTEDYGRHPGFETPVYSWLPSVAISSLTQVNNFHPAWDGDLLAGSLAGRTLFRIRLQEGRILFDERIHIGNRIRYVHQHGDQIALWTDERQVIKLSVGEFDAGSQFAVAKIEELDLTPQQKLQTGLVLDQCSECHSYGSVAGGNAPGLGLVYERDIAAVPSFEYSTALSAKPGAWTREALTAYLSDTNAFAQGTAMPNPEISDPAVVTAVIDILQALRFQPE
jgi:cytochrome c2